EKYNMLKTAAGCKPATANVDIDINNVRARMNNAGDMWWDLLGNARYEVPKGSGKHSLFAGSAWVGGVDAESQLKVCAQTYRQDGNDYWPGPISNLTQDIDEFTCDVWDKIWRVTAVDVAAFRELYASGGADAVATDLRFQSIREWPASGNVDAKGKGQIPLPMEDEYAQRYAPFKNGAGNSDDIYSWQDGDYPDILGDQYTWWVFNDKGNIKANTG